MVLLSSSRTFCGMHVKLTNERTPYNCARLTDVSLPALGFSVTEQAATEYVTHYPASDCYGGAHSGLAGVPTNSLTVNGVSRFCIRTGWRVRSASMNLWR